MNQSSKKLARRLWRNSSIIFLLTAMAIVSMVILFNIGQSSFAQFKQKQDSERVLDEVVATLEANSNQVHILTDRFHMTNQISVQMIEQLAEYGKLNYIPAAWAAGDDIAITYMKEIVETAGVEDLMLTSVDSTVLLSSKMHTLADAYNLIQSDTNPNGVLTAAQFRELSRTDGNRRGTSEKDPVTGEITSVFPVQASIKDDEGLDRTVFFYSYPIMYNGQFTGTYYIIPSYTDELDFELSNIKDIKLILNGIHVGLTGFTFSVDTKTQTFTYYDDGTSMGDLTGRNYLLYGLTEDAVKDGYAGRQTIKDIEYYCVSRAYYSDVYGYNTVVAAVVSEDEINGSNSIVVGWSVMAFCVCLLIVVTYMIIVQIDEIRNGTFMANRKKIIKVFKQTYYLSLNIGRKTLPYLMIGLLIVFFVTFYAQTLSNLSRALRASEARMIEVSTVLEKNAVTVDTISGFYAAQSEDTANLIAYMLEHAPELVFNYDQFDYYHYDYAKDANNKVVLDNYGNPVWTARYHENLQNICTEDDLNAIYVFDENGRVIATNKPYWNFVLSEDPEAQSYPFRDILTEKDVYVQEISENEKGEVEQITGVVFYYYTYNDDGVTRFVSDRDAKSGVIVDGVVVVPPSEITRHRGLLQITVEPTQLQDILKITNIGYILDGMSVTDNGFFMAIEDDPDYTIAYAPEDYVIGRKSADLGIATSTLINSYTGLQSVNGEKYFVNLRYASGFYIGVLIPTDSLYEARPVMAGAATLIALIYLIIIGFFLMGSSSSDDDLYLHVALEYAKEEDARRTITITLPNGTTKQVKVSSLRIDGEKLKWRNRTTEEKIALVLKQGVYIFAVAIVIALIFAKQIFPANSIITFILSQQWELTFNIFSVTYGVIIMILVLIGANILSVIIKFLTSALGQRTKTVGNLIQSVIKYGSIIGAAFYMCHLFGINTSSLVTSAGILSIVVGLGAQSLIGDILAGIFIVFEGEFQVGDFITIGDFRGKVIDIGIRTTKVEDVNENNVKIFNNSDISGILNMTKESSFAVSDVGISYNESIERVEAVLREEFPNIRERLPAITDGPFYKGVLRLDDSAVVIRILAQCEEEDRIQLARDLNRELFIAFNRHNVNIPFPQVTVSYAAQERKEVSTNESMFSEEFVAEQRILTKDMGDGGDGDG